MNGAVGHTRKLTIQEIGRIQVEATEVVVQDTKWILIAVVRGMHVILIEITSRELE